MSFSFCRFAKPLLTEDGTSSRTKKVNLDPTLIVVTNGSRLTMSPWFARNPKSPNQ